MPQRTPHPREGREGWQVAKHTPGPWIVERGGYIVDARQSTIAECHSGGAQSIAESQANERLIAAAPDLLAALRELHTLCVRMDAEGEAARPSEQEYQATLAGAKRALAKAEAA